MLMLCARSCSFAGGVANSAHIIRPMHMRMHRKICGHCEGIAAVAAASSTAATTAATPPKTTTAIINKFGYCVYAAHARYKPARYYLACEFIEILEIRIETLHSLCMHPYKSISLHLCMENGFFFSAILFFLAAFFHVAARFFSAQKLYSSFHFGPFEWMRNNFITYTNLEAWDQPNLLRVYIVCMLYTLIFDHQTHRVYMTANKKKYFNSCEIFFPLYACVCVWPCVRVCFV